MEDKEVFDWDEEAVFGLYNAEIPEDKPEDIPVGVLVEDIRANTVDAYNPPLLDTAVDVHIHLSGRIEA